MAIREKITLVDDYSAKASKIAKSTSAMADAMSKSRSVAGAMASALKTAFNRNYTVKINEIGSSKVRKEISDLQKNLNSVSKGAYSVSVSAKESRMEKLKSNLSDIKEKLSDLKNKPLKFKTNVSKLIEAKRKAREISKELSRMTGKRHKVNIDLGESGGGIFSRFKNGIKGLFSKLNPMNWFKGKGGGGGMAGGEMEGFSVKKLILGNLLTKGIEGAVGGVKSLVSTSLGAGMQRLSNIQSAKARLKGFGYDKEQVNQITTSATNAVTGTQYSMGDAMTASAGAIAAGIKPGELQGYLEDVGNAAAATGADFNDVASIMNKVKTTGHLQADEMRQLSDRGLPILSKLAEQAGISTEEMSKKISQGEVTFDQFRKAVSGASGTAAEEMAKTKEGAFMNFKSALSKLGAGLLGGNGENGEEGGVFSLITPALLKANDVLNSLVPKFKDAGDAIKNFVVDGFNKAKAGFSKVSELLKPGIEKVKEKFTVVFEKLGEAFAPLKDAFSNMFSGGLDQGMGLFSTLIDVVANALSFLADVIITASPIIQSVVSFISANVIPVIGNIVGWISGTLIPAIAGVASNVMGVLVPIIQTVASFISAYIMPILQVLGSIITGTVVVAFNLVAGVVETVIGVFNNLVGAVGEAINAFFSIPGKIAKAIGNIGGSILSTVGGWFGVGKSKGHATGTEYFTGGFTRINERGEEMIQLARGDKIYPADKTSRIIKNEVQNTRTVDRSVAKPTINITVNGANMTNKDVAMVISNEIRRLGVLV